MTPSSPPPQKKTATITTTTSQIVSVTLIENFPTHFVSAFFLTLTPSVFVFSVDSLAFALSSSPVLTSNSWQFILLMLNLEIAYTNLLKAPHLKVGRLAFETITGKFRPQKHHWRSHLVRQVCMWCNQVIILQDPVTENTTIFSSCSRHHLPLWFGCSLMGKPSGAVRSWATHNSLI